ncbi:hypothetical protein [Campylobacter ureolyticus]|uniref:Uncharacterized protein n=1 Tax=Campylobacter ureolyticus TaxID=827 RepID=A0A9Q4PUH5_9BACT|nr:hypothetical protein [Campylobacter ureolyticus]MCZ6135299.1 hypothetical protein [Campylobacter ureolyticus]MCZ6159326.1 hypothetical protein [Campylobacter ureolyticus]MCZ6171225.1 hypothetical protein [Campylobacter ureolyticus]
MSWYEGNNALEPANNIEDRKAVSKNWAENANKKAVKRQKLNSISKLIKSIGGLGSIFMPTEMGISDFSDDPDFMSLTQEQNRNFRNLPSGWGGKDNSSPTPSPSPTPTPSPSPTPFPSPNLPENNLLSILNQQNNILIKLVNAVGLVGVATVKNISKSDNRTYGDTTVNKQNEAFAIAQIQMQDKINSTIGDVAISLKGIKEAVSPNSQNLEKISQSLKGLKLDPVINLPEMKPSFAPVLDVKPNINPTNIINVKPATVDNTIRVESNLNIKDKVKVDFPSSFIDIQKKIQADYEKIAQAQAKQTENSDKSLELEEKTYEIYEENDKYNKEPRALTNFYGETMGKMSPREVAVVNNAMNSKVQTDEDDFGKDGELDDFSLFGGLDISELLKIFKYELPGKIDEEYFRGK